MSEMNNLKITGYTCVSKLDATKNSQCSYCAHPDYAGEEWYDLGLFYSTDSCRVQIK